MAEKPPGQPEPVMNEESPNAMSCEVSKATVYSVTMNSTFFNDIPGLQTDLKKPILEFIVHGAHVRRPVWV
jgi:hypothetical protein